MATMKTLNGYGFNATELGGVDASNYLKKTDTASDTSKFGGKAPEYYLQPRNLLDNSDFRNPVNQRGQTDYTSNGYTIDRWELYSGAVGVSSLGYITTSGQMYQKIAVPTDKVYTFAIENDAGIALITGIPANGIHSATLGNALIKIATIGEYVEVVIEPSEGHNLAGVYWAALYEGSYTADTLPPYVPKGYAAELAECRRYFVVLSGNLIGIAHPYTTNDVYITLYMPTKMRRKPTVELTYLRISNNNYITDSDASISSVDNMHTHNTAITFFANTSSTLTLGRLYGVSTIGGVYISADL